MKKRKTYEVSVINKTYSKTYSNETKFYTSDTALELNFLLKEVEYDFDSAEIILLNVDDRSLATRPVNKSADGFTYELEDDIVEHYGEWKGQLKFNECGEIYVSSPVSFRIENDLNNDRPPKLTEVNTWKNLREIADGLIADIRSELELVAVKVSEIESAESERQSAELVRVENEEQRKIDHANRSAELDGKADKVVLNNLIKNGNFIDGVKNINLSPGTRIENQKLIHEHGTSGFTTRKFNKRLNDDLYYVYIKYNTDEAFSAYKLSNNQGPIYSINSSSSFHSHRQTYPNSAIISIYGGQDATHDLVVDYYLSLNLTETFGVGNEPSKEEMDRLIEITGYIDSEYALNNKETLIWTLALIRLNKNAIIALGGA